MRQGFNKVTHPFGDQRTIIDDQTVHSGAKSGSPWSSTGPVSASGEDRADTIATKDLDRE
jgi:hypothetical protein